MNQTGGVEPVGLTALIAAILSGGVGYVGYKSDTRNNIDVAAEQLKGEYETKLRDAKNQAASALALSNEATKRTTDYEKLKADYEELKAKYSALESKADYLSKAAAIFKNASSEALKAAIPLVLRKLSAKYAWVDREGERTPALKKALEYPATYTGRLARMPLYDFYMKRVLPSIEKDTKPRKGGRGKRRYRRSMRGRGMEDELAAVEQGQDASYLGESGSAASYSVPSYEEFAELYSRSIEEATAALPTFRKKMDAELKAHKESVAIGKKVGDEIVARKAQEKKDAAAKKAADTIVAQLDVAIKAGDEALAIDVPEERKEELRPLRVKLGEKLDVARELVGNPEPGQVPKKKRFGFFGGASNLREVKTEAEWTELNTPTPAKDLLEELKTATKEYKSAVTKVPKAASKSAPILPATAPPPPEPEEPMVMIDNPLFAPKSQSEPGTPSSQVLPLEGSDFDVMNPLRLTEARQAQEAEVAAEPLRKPTRRKSPFSKGSTQVLGGKARKRTLKKRRGGK